MPPQPSGWLFRHRGARGRWNNHHIAIGVAGRPRRVGVLEVTPAVSKTAGCDLVGTCQEKVGNAAQIRGVELERDLGQRQRRAIVIVAVVTAKDSQS